MVMQPEPIYACYQDIVGKMDKVRSDMTPSGRVFSQGKLLKNCQRKNL